jgi:DHA1 family multidrug resistance protein-like MFS transporter
MINPFPMYIGLWAVGAVAGLIISPLLGASMAVAEYWKFVFWLLMWICALPLRGYRSSYPRP